MLGQQADNKVTITFTGNSLFFQWLEGSQKDKWYKANFTLPAGTSPQQLRATITSYFPTNDTGARDIGTVVNAIFKIEDGLLTLAGMPGAEVEPAKVAEAFENSPMFRYALRKVR
jgi:hypothetical protein